MTQPMSVRLPAFLRQSSADLTTKFTDLEWVHRKRFAAGTQPPVNPSDPISEWARLTGDKIAARNRYLNVEPYAKNRVRLLVDDGENDYINASPIQLGTRRYIATQGPKNTSVNHFYRMVASPDIQGPVIVVMLTQTHEGGREKCFQYYPLSESDPVLNIPPDDSLSDGFQGQVELQSIKTDQRTRTEVRHLRLTTTTHGSARAEKPIIHCLFSGWPDFSVPEGQDRLALVELVRLSARLNATSVSNGASHPTDTGSQSNPRIIHCSAGVGRSGTFIALDYILHLIDTGKLDKVLDDEDPIFETVSNLRDQRMMMVQGVAQFHFLYDVVRDLLSARFSSVGIDEQAGPRAADDRG